MSADLAAEGDVCSSTSPYGLVKEYEYGYGTEGKLKEEEGEVACE